jgi:kynurenine formamidase
MFTLRTLLQTGALALVLLLTMTVPAGEAPAGGSASDARNDHGELPEGVTPWWPSRYGADDQLGSLNEITPAAVLAAAALVKQGQVVDMGRLLDDNTPKFPGRYWHQTVDASAHFTNRRRPDSGGQGWGQNQINWITEIQSGTFQVGTQLDSIGHIQIGERFYNGLTVSEVVEEWGLNHYGMETVPPVVTRGVLVDVAGYKGMARLPKGYVISVADVRGALDKQGMDIRQGDAVLFHTGWGALYGKDNELFLSGEPGPGLALVEWLYARRIAITGADTWSYGPVPGEDPERPFLVPQTMYVQFGLFGLENLATEELAARKVYEFLFVLTHGKTRGSTAAIVAPSAIF